MNVISIDGDRKCSGCGVCAVLCPVSAIKMKISEEGFLIPEINSNLCIDCGKCLKVCYKIKENDDGLIDFAQAECYSAVSKDKKTVLASSSGGIATEIALYALDSGYAVCGVAYDTERNMAVAKIIEDKDQLCSIRGSKYIPAWTEEAYKALQSYEKCMVIGTPCQIYGLKKMALLQNKLDKYLFVDFICHGVPSYNVWFRYIDDFKRKNEIKTIDELSFRDKKYGWHVKTIRIKAEGKEYFFKGSSNDFYAIFDNGQAYNVSCYDCKLHRRFGCSDLRVGDYWGELFNDNEAGVSLVAIGTKKGREVFNGIENKIDYSSQSKVSHFFVHKPKYFNKCARDVMFSALKENNNLKSTIKKYQKYYPFAFKIDRKVQKILPNFLYIFYRKIKSYIKKLFNYKSGMKD